MAERGLTSDRTAPTLGTPQGLGPWLTRIREPGMAVVSILLFLLLWQALSSTILNPYLIPPPSRIFAAASPMIRSGELFRDTAISLSRVAVGFFAGSVLAILLGVLMGRLRLLNEMMDPIVELLRYHSPTAMISIAVIWFGIGETSKYFLIFWGTFFIVLINAIAGVLRTPLTRQRAAQCMGASQLQIFLLVVFPSAVPYIVTGMRVALASAYMSLIPAEMLAADSGLGYLLQQSGMLLETDRIFVALLTISVLGFTSDRLFRLLVKRTLSRYMTTTVRT